MNFEEYCEVVSKSQKLSSVKIKILRALWGDEILLNSKWMPSSQLLKITNQKYFDRRARELRDQNGCDIQSSIMNGEHVWRLNSTALSSGNLRAYLTNAQKENLFKIANYRCAVCGSTMDPGIRGLQADHKKPLNRGGTNDLSNWQPLCNECNVAKRRACAGCNADCNTCSWCVPDTIGLSISFKVDPKNFDIINNKLKIEPNFIENAIAFYLKNQQN